MGLPLEPFWTFTVTVVFFVPEAACEDAADVD
jgi:hypothetical protein